MSYSSDFTMPSDRKVREMKELKKQIEKEYQELKQGEDFAFSVRLLDSIGLNNMIKRGLSIHTVVTFEGENFVPLALACKVRNARLIQALLALGADPSVKSGGNTPLEHLILGEKFDLNLTEKELKNLEACVQLLRQHDTYPGVQSWVYDTYKPILSKSEILSLIRSSDHI